MNPRKQQSTGDSARIALGEWLNQNTASVAQSVVDVHYANRPDLVARYGGASQAKCVEDIRYHLHFLKEAILTDSPRAFEQYVSWAKITLLSRRIDVEDFSETLALIPDAVGNQVPPEQRSMLRSLITSTLELIPTMPSEAATFISDDSPYADLANQYLASLLVMNRSEAIDTVMYRVDHGLTLRDLFDHVIAPVQRETGRLWQQNLISVLQEHYITASTELLIARVQGRYTWTQKESYSAVCVCPPGEHHCLGLHMFSELLEVEGWNPFFIGANTPISSVTDHLQKFKTDLLVVSATVLMNLGGVRELIAAVRELEIPPKILLGGGVVTNESTAMRTLGADAFANNLEDGLLAANRLMRERV